MFNKKIFLLAIILVAILSISVVSAEDSMDPLESVGDSDVDESVVDSDVDEGIGDSVDSVDDSAVLDESIENVETIDESSDSVSIENTEELDSKEIDTVESADVNSDNDVEEELISNKGPKNTLKSSSDNAPYNVYVDPLTTYYVSGKNIYFGWQGYFSGYFIIVKGKSAVYNEYLSGYDDDRQYCIDDLDAGTYYAALVDKHEGVFDISKVVIKKATTKITVKSFSITAGKKVTCRAYVKDKNDGANIDGGTVKFRIAGKTYKAKLKHGVAKITFKAPKKIKTYVCKVTYPGGKNIKASSKKFKMKVKKKIKTKLSTFRIKSNYYDGGKYLYSDHIMVYYSTKMGQYGKGLTINLEDGYNPFIGPFYNKLTKVKAFYKNKRTGKIVTKTKKLGYYGVSAHFNVKKGYKLYKVNVWHRRLTANERKNFIKIFS